MKDKVTLADIVEQLSDETYISKTAAQEFISHLTDVLLDDIQDKEKAAITNFGSFTVVNVAERKGVNPQTGETITIPAHKRLSFTPYKALEKKVNHEFDHLEARVLEDNSADEKPEKETSKPKSETETNSAEALFNTLTTSPGKQPSPDDDPFNFEDDEDSNEAKMPEPREIPDTEVASESVSTPISEDELLDDILGLSEEGDEEKEVEKDDEYVEDAPVASSFEMDDSTLSTDYSTEKTPEPSFELDETEDLEEEEVEIEATEEEASKETEEKNSALKTPGLPNRDKAGVSPTFLLGVVGAFLILIIATWFFFFRTDSQPQTADSSTPTATQADPINDPLAFEPPAESEATTAEAESESQVIPMIADDVDLSENPGEMMSIEQSEPQIELQEVLEITYTTSSGVWIYEIARQTYGNTRLWPLIFQANYTTANDPDLILPNVNLNIPKLEGTTDNPSSEDYRRLADAARYVAVAYEQAGNSAQAEEYRKAAIWYESMR
ncbi:MAG: HU family DNA-binding protein [bacterium]|nr:HU family DNA-binding protein [bacterium]